MLVLGAGQDRAGSVSPAADTHSSSQLCGTSSTSTKAERAKMQIMSALVLVTPCLPCTLQHG